MPLRLGLDLSHMEYIKTTKKKLGLIKVEPFLFVHPTMQMQFNLYIVSLVHLSD